MAIDKMKLFESAQERWPLSFRVASSDGNNNPNLTDVYRTIEASCDPIGGWTPADNWTQLANWAFHQALFQLAQEADAESDIHRQSVTFARFDHWMRFNLSDDGYTAEREEYESSPLRLQ
jgi:hypothetical protein